MKNENHIKEFEDFCKDHILHFDGAIPCEFETSDGIFYNAKECWEVAEKLKLI